VTATLRAFSNRPISQYLPKGWLGHIIIVQVPLLGTEVHQVGPQASKVITNTLRRVLLTMAPLLDTEIHPVGPQVSKITTNTLRRVLLTLAPLLGMKVHPVGPQVSKVTTNTLCRVLLTLATLLGTEVYLDGPQVSRKVATVGVEAVVIFCKADLLWKQGRHGEEEGAQKSTIRRSARRILTFNRSIGPRGR
jgi:hypothetical protein